MKSREKKEKELNDALELLEKSKSLIFIDFYSLPVNLMNELRNSFKKIDSTIKVMKKNLFRILFSKKKINVDVSNFNRNLATIFNQHNDIIESSGIVYNFMKKNKNEAPEFSILGGYDLQLSKEYNTDEIISFGKIPSRNVLLSQIVSLINTPIKSLVFVLSKIAEIKNNNNSEKGKKNNEENNTDEIKEKNDNDKDDEKNNESDLQNTDNVNNKEKDNIDNKAKTEDDKINKSDSENN